MSNSLSSDFQAFIDNRLDCADEILKDSADYRRQTGNIESATKELLLAISQEGKATKITSVNFVKRHKIYSTSTVQSACNGLLDKELITEENGQYFVYDKFFDLWLRQNY